MRGLYCVLGDPVAHSRSPALMSRAFALLGVDAAYVPCRVAAEDLPRAVAGLRALGARGFNVTVPHKAAALALCDRVDPEAARIGAVNCVSREGELLMGRNTDAPGLVRALRAAGLETPFAAGARVAVAIVGAGGSARAAAAALSGAASLSIVNRTRARAEELARAAREAGARAEAAALDSPEAAAALAAADLVVHCSTVGMGTSEMAFDVGRLRPQAAVADLVYAGPPGARAGDTALIVAARARGLRTVDGIDVLVHQAIASLEIWLQRADLRALSGPLREAALGAPEAA